MLALVHPFDPSSQDVPHRASPSSSRNRHHHRKPTPSRESSSSAVVSLSSSSSSSILKTSTSTTMTTSSSSSSRHAPQPPALHQTHRHQSTSLPVPSSSSAAVASEEPKTNGISPSYSGETMPASDAPFDIQSFPSSDLLRLLASLLTQIAATNDKLDASSATSADPSPSSPSSLTSPEHHTPIWNTLTTASRSALSTPSSTLTFHARNIPTISLEAYLLRILKYCPTTNEVFLSLLVYFDRMSKLSAEATGRSFIIDSYNIHRLVIAGVTVASKFFSDVFYTNSRYAKVGGLPQAELNQLELQFLLLNDFRLVIPRHEMQAYAEQLILFSSKSSSDSLPSFTLLPSSPNPSLTSSVSETPRIAGPSTAPAASIPRMNANDVAAPMRSMGAFDAYGGQIPGGSANSHSIHAYASYPSSHQPQYATPVQTQSEADAGRIKGAATPMTRQYAQRGYEPGHPLARIINPSAHLPHHAVNGLVNGHGVSPSSLVSRTMPTGSEDSESDAGDGGETETETETEAETETDGGWTTDDEPTIKPPRSSAGSSSSSSRSSRASDAQSICSSTSEGVEGDDERDEIMDNVIGEEEEGGKTPERAGRAEGGREGEKTPERRPLHEFGMSKINGSSLGRSEQGDHSMAST